MILPFLLWIKESNLSTVKDDLLSGLTVALVLIPQSMAYAQLAGLPPHFGLYASFLPPMVAALFGSSRQLATGPVAVVSLMTSATLEPLATAGSVEYIEYAVLLALLVGLFQFLLGVLRLGVVVNFLSHPVVNGFTNAAAIIIATSQLDKIFGVSVEKAEHHYETVARTVAAAIEWTHLPTLAMAVLAFAIMMGLRRINPRIPNVLIAVVVTTALSAVFHFEHNEVVAVPDIESSRLESLVEEFNFAVDLQKRVNEVRSNAGSLSSEIETKAIDSQCQRCHGPREPEALVLAPGARDDLGIEGRTLALHHMAGVLDVHAAEIKEEISSLRSELRSMVFARVPDGNQGRFYEQALLPEGSPTDGRHWRLKVGNNPLDPDALLMIGGGNVVGVIPRGLPSAKAPRLDMNVIPKLLTATVIISLLGFMEAISIAKAMAAKTGQRLDPNQELIGQGLANMVGSVGQSYPVSGSFSRSAVNLQAGGKTGLSSVITSFTVVIVLLFFTPLLYHLPQAVLASVIMMAVIGLVNVTGFVHAWKAKRYDGIISVTSFVATLAFAPHLDKGIMIGVVLSVAVFLYKSMRPTVISLSRHEDDSLRAAQTHGLEECRFMDVVRFDGPLFFANASYLEDKINERMQAKQDLRHIIIVSNAISDIDASGEETLSLLVDRVRTAGVDISFSGVNESVMDVLERTFLIERIGRDHIYPTMEQAIRAVHAHAHNEGEEEPCPLTTTGRAGQIKVLDGGP
ncbi:MAG: STAS domain-containing protein [Acidobacteria bacterium]|jgi:SulP family sulfate permease|nr:STAS domain-containing protein [Acidobacteriota bacterium]